MKSKTALTLIENTAFMSDPAIHSQKLNEGAFKEQKLFHQLQTGDKCTPIVWFRWKDPLNFNRVRVQGLSTI